MKHIATMALMLNLAIASVYAQHPVKMMFSGTGGAGLIDLKQPGAANVEEIETGNGTLGPFTIRIISAETAPLQEQPSTCSGPTHLYSERVAGGGVLRFRDGSLLMVSLTQGTDCIDLAAQQALCTITFQVIGGTGRFKMHPACLPIPRRCSRCWPTPLATQSSLRIQESLRERFPEWVWRSFKTCGNRITRVSGGNSIGRLETVTASAPGRTDVQRPEDVLIAGGNLHESC
jgi:hypothetical protein